MERVTDANENIVEVFENDIEYYLQEFAEKQNIDDFRSVPQSVWNGALRYVYKHVFKDSNILKCTTNTTLYSNIPSNHNMYNYDMVNYVLNIYLDYCMNFNKEISILGFSNLTGIDNETINVWGDGNNKLSTAPFGIYKKLVTMREESLANKLADGKQNPVGVIAMLNRHYGWASPYTADARKQQGALSAAELPKLGGKMSVSQGLLPNNCVVDAQIKED